MAAEALLAPTARAVLADGFVAEDHDHLAVEVARFGEAVVAIGPLFDAVADEGEFALDFAATGVGEHPVVDTFLEGLAADRDRCEEHLGPARGKDEGLPVAVAEGRFEAVAAQPVLDVVGGPFDASRAGLATLEVGVREGHHMLVPLAGTWPEALEHLPQQGRRWIDLDEGLLRGEAVDVDRAFHDPLAGGRSPALLRDRTGGDEGGGDGGKRASEWCQGGHGGVPGVAGG